MHSRARRPAPERGPSFSSSFAPPSWERARTSAMSSTKSNPACRGSGEQWAGRLFEQIWAGGGPGVDEEPPLIGKSDLCRHGRRALETGRCLGPKCVNRFFRNEGLRRHEGDAAGIERLSGGAGVEDVLLGLVG